MDWSILTLTSYLKTSQFWIQLVFFIVCSQWSKIWTFPGRAEPGRIGVPVLPQISGFVLIYLSKNSLFQKDLLDNPPLEKIHSSVEPRSAGFLESLWGVEWVFSQRSVFLWYLYLIQDFFGNANLHLIFF